MANTYLTWTPSSSGTRAKWTFSAWVKKGETTANGTLFFAGGSNSDYSKILLQTDGKLYISEVGGGSTVWEVQTNRLFRDPSAFYHIVIVYDSGQGTASNRVKIYINGVQETSFSATSYPAQNRGAMWLAGGTEHRIGRDYISQYFGGVISYVNFSDGYALAPSVFGSVDSTTGEWKINTSPSFTLGTYGFTILKDGNTITDQSTNSNNWSLGGGTLTKTEDCPSNVFATLNSIDKNSTLTLTNGNNTSFAGSTGWSNATRGTLGIASGKFYWEMKITGSGTASGLFFGVCADTVTLITSQGIQDNATEKAKGVLVLCDDGQSQLDTNSRASMTSAPAFNDVLGCAVDRDNNTVKFYKNGSQVGSIDISSSPLASCLHIMPFIINYYTATKLNFNFGNGYFGTTAVSSAGTNASGNGIFEYDVPTGFTALSTKGLNL